MKSKMIAVFVAVILVLSVPLAVLANEPIGYVAADAQPQVQHQQPAVHPSPRTVTVPVPVHHDVPQRALTPLEARFLGTVPDVQGLRGMVKTLLLTGTHHVPACPTHQKLIDAGIITGPDPVCPDCGQYRKGDAARYMEAYQLLTAQRYVQASLIPGRDGRDGEPGADGHDGKDGADGKCIVVPSAPARQDTVVNNHNYNNNISYTFVSSTYPSGQMLGPMAPTVYSNQLVGFSLVPSWRIDNNNILTQSQQQQQLMKQNQEVGINVAGP
ncbi:MAG: hypothetical protein AAB785_02770 [Patescibacteria group bacterium]